MKTFFPFAGLLSILVFVAFLDSPNNTNESTISYYNSDDDTEEVSVQTQEKTVPAYSSLEYVLEGREEVDGSIVETYREYEIYEDEEGNVIKKVPTSHYNYLTYHNYEE